MMAARSLVIIPNKWAPVILPRDYKGSSRFLPSSDRWLPVVMFSSNPQQKNPSYFPSGFAGSVFHVIVPILPIRFSIQPLTPMAVNKL